MNEYSAERESVAYSLLGIGGILRAHRESHAWSIDHVSSMLRLSNRIIEAIESEDWHNLPARVFVRGYIKAYAKILHLDVEEILDQFDEVEYERYYPFRSISVDVVTERISISSVVHKYPGQILGYAAALVVLVVVVVLFIFWPDSTINDTSIALSEPQISETTISDPSIPDDAADSQSTADQLPSESRAGTAEPAMKEVEDGTTNESLGNEGTEEDKIPEILDGILHQLTFTFTDECWLTVSDGNDRSIYQGIKMAGDKLILEGQPPFSLHIGNARAVEVAYNEDPVSLVPHTHGNVARLVLTP